MPEVEPAIMAVRASIRFAIRRQKEMDFKVDKLSASFVFKNPNATNTCGCGSSFSA